MHIDLQWKHTWRSHLISAFILPIIAGLTWAGCSEIAPNAPLTESQETLSENTEWQSVEPENNRRNVVELLGLISNDEKGHTTASTGQRDYLDPHMVEGGHVHAIINSVDGLVVGYTITVTQVSNGHEWYSISGTSCTGCRLNTEDWVRDQLDNDDNGHWDWENNGDNDEDPDDPDNADG